MKLLVTCTLLYVVSAEKFVKFAASKYNADWKTVQSNYIDVVSEDFRRSVPPHYSTSTNELTDISGNVRGYTHDYHYNAVNDVYIHQQLHTSRQPDQVLLDRTNFVSDVIIHYNPIPVESPETVTYVPDHQSGSFQRDLHEKPTEAGASFIVVYDVSKKDPKGFHHSGRKFKEEVEPYILSYDQIDDVPKDYPYSVHKNSLSKQKIDPYIVEQGGMGDVSKQPDGIRYDSQSQITDPYVRLYNQKSDVSKHKPYSVHEDTHDKPKIDPYIVLQRRLNDGAKPGTEGVHYDSSGMTTTEVDPYILLYDQINYVSKHQPESIRRESQITPKTDPVVVLKDGVSDELLQQVPEGMTTAEVDPYVQLYDKISDVSKHQQERVQGESQITPKIDPIVVLNDGMSDELLQQVPEGMTTTEVDPYVQLYDKISDVSKNPHERVQGESQITPKTDPVVVLNDGVSDELLQQVPEGMTTTEVDPYVQLYDKISDVSTNQHERVQGEFQITPKTDPVVVLNDGVSDELLQQVPEGMTTTEVDPYVQLYDRISDVSKNQQEIIQGGSEIKRTDSFIANSLYDTIQDTPKNGTYGYDSQLTTSKPDPTTKLTEDSNETSSTTGIPDVARHSTIEKPALQKPILEFINGFLNLSTNLLAGLSNYLGTLKNSTNV